MWRPRAASSRLWQSADYWHWMSVGIGTRKTSTLKSGPTAPIGVVGQGSQCTRLCQAGLLGIQGLKSLVEKPLGSPQWKTYKPPLSCKVLFKITVQLGSIPNPENCVSCHACVVWQDMWLFGLGIRSYCAIILTYAKEFSQSWASEIFPVHTR